MVYSKPSATFKIAFFLIFLLLFSLYPRYVSGSFDVDLPSQNQVVPLKEESGLIKFQQSSDNNPLNRYIVFGKGPMSQISSSADNIIYAAGSSDNSFAVGIFDKNQATDLKMKGYNVINDIPLEFDSTQPDKTIHDAARVDKILGADKVAEKYNYTGDGIRIGIVDTGTDFSNPDVQNSVARDKNNKPVMIDADGQGIVLTNSTFIAGITPQGVIYNYTQPIPKNITSSVYVTSKGVFLNIHRGGEGTKVKVYNSLYPKGGTAVLDGSVNDDYKIGKDARHFIVSKSGIYHFGIAYESVAQGQEYRLLLVPILVVDSTTAGVYDTIIPDMSDSWKDFKRFDNPEVPTYDFDFTDETPIKIGDGHEFLVYDPLHNGNPIYSAGMVGARVLDVYGVISKPAKTKDDIGAINGTLLPPLDPKGNFLGLMYDYGGHGTATAGSITSEGKQEYDIYGNGTKYVIKGVAPGAKIVPIKALWLGDAMYGWLWAAGFDQENNKWIYSGKPRVDIISNSWGISTFPSLKSVPGLDIQSLLLSALDTPGSIDKNYPGVLVVSSSGNAGPGYGTIGSPDAAPFGLTVGSATDNVYLGYGPFKEQPRFGNSTVYYGDLSGFSSKGPSVIGDPKPDLLAIGEYAFTPSSVTKLDKNSKGSFSLFGGTSLASPLAAGSAAIVMQAFHEKGIPYTPLTIKNLLMSSASDLHNDPFAQGAGLVNVTRAVNFVQGNDGAFSVYNNASYNNIKKVLDPVIGTMNSSSIGLGMFQFTNSSLPSESWFGGRLYPGDRSTAKFTIQNPTDKPLDLKVSPEKLDMIDVSQYNGTTEPRIQDPLITDKGVYRPDYVSLAQVENHTHLLSYFKEGEPIPPDASLMVLDLNFPFSQFLNASSKTYADDMKISSLYFYDWDKKNGNKVPIYKDLSLINRGGSWGTVQELRISDPVSKIHNTPLVGIYPVPTRYSYWSGDTKLNATSINYTVTASYYKRSDWSDIWMDSKDVVVNPHSSATMYATLVVPVDKKPGVYQGFLTFKGGSHDLNVPVSYVVVKKLQPKDLPTVISGSQGDSIFGNGYVSGGFDMSNRYNAGDWREYFFDVKDKTINSLSMILSWKDPDTNLSVFVIDPKGRIIQTNVPPGVLGLFKGWPTGDWLGPSEPFSEGGGFYPIKNMDDTSTVLYAPINETGVYSVLIHTTLFGGSSLTEPITLYSKFSTLLPDENSPTLSLEIPKFINGTYAVNPKITGKNIQLEQYYIDSSGPTLLNSTLLQDSLSTLSDGLHDLRIVISDTVGHLVSKDYAFFLDKTPPKVAFKSPLNDSTVSGLMDVNIDLNESNPLDQGWLTVNLANKTILDNKTFQFDTRSLHNGIYDIQAVAKDKAGNVGTQNVTITVANSEEVTSSSESKNDQGFVTIIAIVIAIGGASAISVITLKKLKISNKN